MLVPYADARQSGFDERNWQSGFFLDTSPLVGEVDSRAASARVGRGVLRDSEYSPPSPSLPHKGGGSRLRLGPTQLRAFNMRFTPPALGATPSRNASSRPAPPRRPPPRHNAGL